MFSIATRHLKAALHCASKADIRYYLNGVLVEAAGEKDVRLVATDGHIMFCGKAAIQDVSGPVGFSPIIIPRETVEAVVKGKAGMVEFKDMGDGKYVLGNQIFAPVDGKFPEWRRVVPQAADGSAACYDPALLARAHKAMGTWASDKVKMPGKTHLVPNGQGAGVLMNDVCSAFVVLMPIRPTTIDTKPPAIPQHVLQ